jgi:spermidine synthase
MAPDGAIVVQATSPYHAKEAFLCINSTMASAGLETVPYHDNVPSFGEWGWILAWRKDSASNYGDQLHSLDFKVETTYLTPEVFRAGMSFGKGWLESPMAVVSTLMRPKIYGYEHQC